MANTKITELTSLTSSNLHTGDVLPIVDVDVNGDGNTADAETKKISIGEFKTGIFTSPTFTGDVTVSSDSYISSSKTPVFGQHLTNKSYVDGAISGISGGSSTLDGLTDTTITSVGDGEIIVYDNSTSKYVNKTLAEAGIATDTAVSAAQADATSALTASTTNTTTLDNLDSDTVIVKKVTGAEAKAMDFATSSTWITLIPSPGAGKVIVIRDLEIFIDRGSWSPLISGTVRGYGGNLQLVVETPASTGGFTHNTFATFQKKYLNHTINGFFNVNNAVDTVIVRDAPAVQARTYPDKPILLRPENANATGNLTTYSQTPDDDYYFRITYKIMDLSTDFAET
jgi:hypothetical protein